MFLLLEENNELLSGLSKSIQGVDNIGVKLNSHNDDDFVNRISHFTMKLNNRIILS